jgi:hypothetical protein
MSWSLVHPQLIDEVFIKNQGLASCVVASSPYPLEELRARGKSSAFLGPMEGEEVMMAFRGCERDR